METKTGLIYFVSWISVFPIDFHKPEKIRQAEYEPNNKMRPAIMAPTKSAPFCNTGVTGQRN